MTQTGLVTKRTVIHTVIHTIPIHSYVVYITRKWTIESARKKESFILGRIKVDPTIMLFVLGFLLIFLPYHFEQISEATGGDVNVLYAGNDIT